MYHFLVNRSAGNGRGEKAWREIQGVLEQRRTEYRVSYPGNAEEAVQHVRSLEPSVETVVIVGGDGSVQSVLRELMVRKLHVGIIPAGSGNDLARGLNIPMTPKAALEVLFTGRPFPVDVIRHGEQAYATAIGVGFDGAVAFAANHSWYKKWLNALGLGRLAYVAALIKTLFHYKPADIELILDGRHLHLTKVWLIAISNFPSYGGGMKICPQAQPDDGYLNICAVHHVSRLEVIRVFPKVYSGTHTSHPAVKMFTAKRVQVHASKPLLAHGDGESIGQSPIEAELQMGSVLVVSHANAAARHGAKGSAKGNLEFSPDSAGNT
ncbi:diacylglycerol kinase family protein [Alicyclobacillus sp. SO9]|uniref:diacylglycerol/lipid kinase family protein n=1 Tax=Alicyclobacillus sp. SO9 TaxID=2665646 RepID=UPI0018E8ECEB|nr:diacylglycerol kinase family protein [Alicyclobacillus sp. SO9]QQE78170.1 diacylglycerol kinase family lipid kinase [Alicyclobacillus sp. SO9]